MASPGLLPGLGPSATITPAQAPAPPLPTRELLSNEEADALKAWFAREDVPAAAKQQAADALRAKFYAEPETPGGAGRPVTAEQQQAIFDATAPPVTPPDAVDTMRPVTGSELALRALKTGAETGVAVGLPALVPEATGASLGARALAAFARTLLAGGGSAGVDYLGNKVLGYPNSPEGSLVKFVAGAAPQGVAELVAPAVMHLNDKVSLESAISGRVLTAQQKQAAAQQALMEAQANEAAAKATQAAAGVEATGANISQAAATGAVQRAQALVNPLPALPSETNTLGKEIGRVMVKASGAVERQRTRLYGDEVAKATAAGLQTTEMAPLRDSTDKALRAFDRPGSPDGEVAAILRDIRERIGGETAPAPTGPRVSFYELGPDGKPVPITRPAMQPTTTSAQPLIYSELDTWRRDLQPFVRGYAERRSPGITFREGTVEHVAAEIDRMMDTLAKQDPATAEARRVADDYFANQVVPMRDATDAYRSKNAQPSAYMRALLTRGNEDRLVRTMRTLEQSSPETAAKMRASFLQDEIRRATPPGELVFSPQRLLTNITSGQGIGRGLSELQQHALFGGPGAPVRTALQNLDSAVADQKAASFAQKVAAGSMDGATKALNAATGTVTKAHAALQSAEQQLTQAEIAQARTMDAATIRRREAMIGTLAVGATAGLGEIWRGDYKTGLGLLAASVVGRNAIGSVLSNPKSVATLNRLFNAPPGTALARRLGFQLMLQLSSEGLNVAMDRADNSSQEPGAVDIGR